MARIRTIKPEFWSDDNMLDLSDSCALFYISLWNFCDDEGKIENKPRAISKLVCRWSEGKVKLFIKTLSTSGRLRISIDSTWLQVENWAHQKIDRPKQPKILLNDIQWVTSEDSSTNHRPIVDNSTQGEDSIGKESIGLDSSPITTGGDDGFRYSNPKKPPRETNAVSKEQIFEMLFTDDLYVENLAIVHRGKDYQKAFNECYIHHSNAPNPPKEIGEWKQKLNTWLINTKQNGSSKKTGNKNLDHISSLAESHARRYGADGNNGGKG